MYLTAIKHNIIRFFEHIYRSSGLRKIIKLKINVN